MPLNPERDSVGINGVNYPVSSWSRVQTMEPLKRAWRDGFFKGAAQPRYQDNQRYYYGHGWDMTSPPYARLALASAATIDLNVSGALEFDGSKPTYFIQTRNTTTPFANVLYMLSGQYVWKFNLDTNARVYGPVAYTAATFGRPALFEGKWRIPAGGKSTPDDATSYPNSVTLTPTTAAATFSTEIVAIGTVKARHFAVLPPADSANDPTWKIAKSFSGLAGAANRVELFATIAALALSGNADTGYEVGDKTFPASDMVVGQGELIIFKPDGPYRFDPEGNALPLQQWVGATLKSTGDVADNQFHGSNSCSHGTFVYWVHPSSIWRIFSNTLLPVGFEADPAYYGKAALEIDPGGQWYCAVAYGRWIYAVRGGQVWQGYIQENGVPIWYGAMFDTPPNAKVRLGMTDGPALLIATDTGLAITDDLHIINLAADGSTRGVLSSNRGPQSISNLPFRIGSIDFEIPERLKQLKKLWFFLEGMGGGTSLQPVVERDGAAVENWEAAITANGYTERVADPMGTTDTFRETLIGCTVSGHPGNTDPRIRSMGMECVAAGVIEAIIPLKGDFTRGFSSGIVGALDQLRTLQNGAAVEVQAPGRTNTFTCYVMAVRETLLSIEGPSNPEYEVKVYLETFNAEEGTT